MRKAFLLLFLLFFLVFPSVLSAAPLLLIEENGDITVNVLSAQSQLALDPTQSTLEIKRVAGKMPEGGDIVLKKEGTNYNIYFGESRPFDITNWKEAIIQIEEKEKDKQAEVVLDNGEFVLVQSGVRASIPFPIKINPKQKKFQIETPYGDKYLAVLPLEAALISLRSRSLSKLNELPFDLVEENKDLVYKIYGKRYINIFNFYTLDTDVVAKVSASTGEIIFVEEPLWLKVLTLFLV